MLDVPGRFSNVTSMESLDKLTHKDFESFRILWYIQFILSYYNNSKILSYSSVNTKNDDESC